MKKITVRYFAAFREAAGINQEIIDTHANSAGDLFRSLSHRHGSSEPLGHCKVAINDEMASWEDPISDGDTVLLFPPVAGG